MLSAPPEFPAKSDPNLRGDAGLTSGIITLSSKRIGSQRRI